MFFERTPRPQNIHQICFGAKFFEKKDVECRNELINRKFAAASVSTVFGRACKPPMGGMSSNAAGSRAACA
jgi:hypothetical protein